MAIQIRGETRRDAIWDYIYDYRLQHGYAPSITEIARETGTARSNVHHHLTKLQKEGRLTFSPHIARSWVVTQ